MKKLFGENK